MNKIQLCLIQCSRRWVGGGKNPANDGHWEYSEDAVPISEPIDVEDVTLRHLIESACRAVVAQSDNLRIDELGWRQV